MIPRRFVSDLDFVFLRSFKGMRRMDQLIQSSDYFVAGYQTKTQNLLGTNVLGSTQYNFLPRMLLSKLKNVEQLDEKSSLKL